MATLVGQTTATGGADFFGAGDLAASKYVASNSGTAATMSILLRAASSFTSMALAIYADNGSNAPGALLGQTSAITDTTAGVKTASLTAGVAITSGTTYWLACLALGGNLDFNDVPGGLYQGRSSASSFTDPFGTIAWNDLSNGVPIQADSAAGGGATITAVPAGATGAGETPGPSAGSTATAVPASGTGQAPAASFGVSSTQTPGPAGAQAGAPVPGVAAGATVAAVPASETSTAPVQDMPVSVNIDADADDAAAHGVGSAPAPTVSGTGSTTISPPAASEQGGAPAPTESAGATVGPGPASGTDRAPAPTISATGNATIAAPAAGSAAGAPAPAVSGAPAAPTDFVGIGIRRSIAFTSPVRTAVVTTTGRRQITFTQPRRSATVEQAERVPVPA